MKLTSTRGLLKKFISDHTLILLVSIAFLFPVSLTLLHSHETSPIDEWVFIDYTDKVFEQGYVREGERVGGFTVDLMACEGVLPGSKIGICGAGESNYAVLPYTGLTAAAAYTPTYFFLTRTMGIPFQILGADPLTSWRLTGALWLASGIFAFVKLLRLWGISNRVIIPLGLLVISSPFVWWAHSFVSTDAPSILIGAVLLIMATKIQRGQLNPWWLLPITSLAVAIKVTNLVSVGLVVVYLFGGILVELFRNRNTPNGWVQELKHRQKFLFAVVISALIPVLMQVAWAKFISATAISAERVDQGISMQLTATELSLQVVNFLPSSLSYSPFSGHGKDFIWVPLSWIPIAGVIGAFFLFNLRSEKKTVVISILLAALTMAPLLAIAVQIAQGEYFQLSPRYGASLIPAFMLCVAFILRNRFAQVVLALYAVLLFAVGLYAGITLT